MNQFTDSYYTYRSPRYTQYWSTKPVHTQRWSYYNIIHLYRGCIARDLTFYFSNWKLSNRRLYTLQHIMHTLIHVTKCINGTHEHVNTHLHTHTQTGKKNVNRNVSLALEDHLSPKLYIIYKCYTHMEHTSFLFFFFLNIIMYRYVKLRIRFWMIFILAELLIFVNTHVYFFIRKIWKLPNTIGSHFAL